METTYLKIYGICDPYLNGTFVPQSGLVKTEWAKNADGSYVTLGGSWHNSSFTSVYQNYFVVTQINGISVDPALLDQQLISLSKNCMATLHPGYDLNVVYFAGDTSLGFEYPAISTVEESQISADLKVFEYQKILRYAFASSYVYFLDDPSNFPFKDDPTFKQLMTDPQTGKINVIKQLNGTSGVVAAAIKAPTVGSSLPQEIIIAYKGTNQKWDVWADFQLSVQNFFELNKAWQQESYDFFKTVITDYPPSNTSVQEGYVTYNGPIPVVLTGHSLGGYTAIQTGIRTGVSTRAFSAPASKIISEYISMFSNTLFRNYCLNFVREYDPVVAGSGRHEENMVYFPSAKAGLFDSHYLTPFINDILLPLSKSLAPDLTPTYLYVTPVALTSSGLTKPINEWGAVQITAWSTDQLIPDAQNAYGTSGTPALIDFNYTLFCIREGRGNSGWVWCGSTVDGLAWAPDQLIPDSNNAYGTSGTPAMIVFKDRLYCIRQGRDNSGWIWCGSSADGASWNADQLIPDANNAYGTSGTPALTVFKDKLYCIREGRGNSGWVWCGSTADSASWDADQLIPDANNAYGTSGTPGLIVFKDKLYCIREGRGNSGWVWCGSTADGVSWNADQLIPDANNAYGTSGTPGLIVFKDKLYCIREGRGDNGWVWCGYTSDGVTWSADQLIPDSQNAYGTSSTPALLVVGDKLYCIREGRGNSGWVWCASTSDGITWSADQLIPNSSNAYGTSGTPTVINYNNTTYCIREGRGNSGWTWMDPLTFDIIIKNIKQPVQLILI